MGYCRPCKKYDKQEKLVTMKKIVLVMLVMGIWFPTLAQQSQSLFEQLTDKYAEKDGFSASMLSSDMFDLYLKKKNLEEDSELAKAFQGLDNILVVSQSSFNFTAPQYRSGFVNPESDKPAKSEKGNTIHKEILNHYKNGGYTLLKTEKRMGEDVKVYLKKAQTKVNAIALITNSSSATNLVELQGDDIDLSNVAQLSKAINLRGLENLYKIDNSSSNYFSQKDYFRGYEFDEQHMAEIAEQAKRMAEQAQLSEEQIAKIEEQAHLQAKKQMEMAEKYREMAEKYGRQPIFLSTPGDTNTVYIIDGKEVEAKDVKEMLEKEEIEQISKNSKNGKTVIKIQTK